MPSINPAWCTGGSWFTLAQIIPYSLHAQWFFSPPKRACILQRYNSATPALICQIDIPFSTDIVRVHQYKPHHTSPHSKILHTSKCAQNEDEPKCFNSLLLSQKKNLIKSQAAYKAPQEEGPRRSINSPKPFLCLREGLKYVGFMSNGGWVTTNDSGLTKLQKSRDQTLIGVAQPTSAFNHCH